MAMTIDKRIMVFSCFSALLTEMNDNLVNDLRLGCQRHAALQHQQDQFILIERTGLAIESPDIVRIHHRLSLALAARLTARRMPGAGIRTPGSIHRQQVIDINATIDAHIAIADDLRFSPSIDSLGLATVIAKI
jgi:hypothetical protein